ncbi:hypothetical protein AUR64_17735 [Haloprofundus marisrubri]|uniref:Uncharacterized protein n=1 Tax=Haloprofundus marisrubri TaxID=1514971 RepID=A0A0W1R591_9EURY|nr:hypothetical protein [Haloprofundus marisrubri]KTG08520.1 hypothetical protein AUR64_17735 [Haloprofundus marisrubri]
MADTDVPTEEKPSRSDGGRPTASAESESSQPTALTLGDLVGTTEQDRTGPSSAWLFRHGLYIGAILLIGFVVLPELMLSVGSGWPVGIAWAFAESLRYGAVILAGMYALNVAVSDALER